MPQPAHFAARHCGRLPAGAGRETVNAARLGAEEW
jgi:hypothetical protein